VPRDVAELDEYIEAIRIVGRAWMVRTTGLVESATVPAPPCQREAQYATGGGRPGAVSSRRANPVHSLTKLVWRKRVSRWVSDMADEGLVLAARAKARLGQALSAAQHAEGYLQVVGVGDWKPTSTRPSWNAEPLPTEEGS
jgi:hypothetical protein